MGKTQLFSRRTERGRGERIALSLMASRECSLRSALNRRGERKRERGYSPSSGALLSTNAYAQNLLTGPM